MGKVYNILAVKRLYRKNINSEKERYYQVTVNDKPGHDVITLQWWKFDGVPNVGAQMESIGTLNPYDCLQWRIHKRKTK